MAMNLASLNRQYVEKKSLIDALQKELDALKIQIIKLHAGHDVVTEGGTESKIVHGTRATLMKDSVTALLGYEIPDSCFKHTSYEQLKVKIIAG